MCCKSRLLDFSVEFRLRLGGRPGGGRTSVIVRCIEGVSRRRSERIQARPSVAVVAVETDAGSSWVGHTEMAVRAGC